MPSPVQLSTQDQVRLSNFYGRIAAATAVDSPGGTKLDKGELLQAAKVIQLASPAARSVGWADVIDLLEPSMDAEVLGGLKAQLTGIPKTLRSANGYVGEALRWRIARGGALPPAVNRAAELEARKVAVQEAIRAQVEAVPGEPAKVRAALLSLLDRCRVGPEVDLVKAAWPWVVTESDSGRFVASSSAVAALDAALGSFQAQGSAASAVEDHVALVQQAAGGGTSAPVAPAAGLSPEQIEQRLESLIEQQGTGRLIYDAAKIRVAAYARTVDGVLNHETVKKILPAVKRALALEEQSYRVQQEAEGGLVLDRDDLDLAVGHSYARPLFDLTQEVAKTLGFTKDVTLVIAPHVLPNAFVYTADLDMPRVTFHEPMVEQFWDHETQDWIKMWVDADGKPAEPHAEGATELPVGKLLVASVLAHELGHIRDQVILTRAVIITIFREYGRSLLTLNLSPADEAAVRQQLKESSGWIGACALTRSSEVEARVRSALRLEEPLGGAEVDGFLEFIDQSVNGRAPSEACSRPHTALSTDGLARFTQALRRLGRAAEATADRYAVAVQGTPEWTALMDAVLGLTQQAPTSDREKLTSLQRLMAMGPERYADRMLARLAQTSDASALGFALGRSHPVPLERIKDDYEFARQRQGFMTQLGELKKLTPDQRLIAVIQLYEKRCADVEQPLQRLEPNDSYDAFEERIQRAQGLEEVRRIEAQMQPFIDLVDELLGETGLADAKHAFAERALQLVRDNGLTLAGKAPFVRLLRHLRERLTALGDTETLSSVQQDTVKKRLAQVQALLSKAPASRSSRGLS